VSYAVSLYAEKRKSSAEALSALSGLLTMHGVTSHSQLLPQYFLRVQKHSAGCKAFGQEGSVQGTFRLLLKKTLFFVQSLFTVAIPFEAAFFSAAMLAATT